MRKLSALAVVALLAAPAVTPAAAQTVLDFESVASCDNTRPNMGVFGGVDFMMQWTCYGFAQSPFNPASGTNRLYAVNGSNNASSAFFSFVGGATTFDGAFFAGSDDVLFRLFLGGSLVSTSSSLSTSATPTFLASGYAGQVDEVEVVGGGTQWVMDDLTYGAAVVPEPVTLLLLGSGLLGIGGVALMRRREDES